MSVAPVAFPPPAEFVARAIAFGALVVVGIAAIVLAGAWWTALIAALGLLAAVAGLVVSVLALLIHEQAAHRRASRPTALGLAALSVTAIVAALIAA
jgi:hypothetical protein